MVPINNLCPLIKIVNNRARVSSVYELSPENIEIKPIEIATTSRKTSDWRFLIYSSDSGFFSDRANRWLLSGNGNPIFLSVNEEFLKKEIKIYSSEWISVFTPKLELGEYFIVEIPKGTKTIEKAWDYIAKAEECFRQWDSKGVYANCRDAGNVLNNEIKEKFKDNPIIKKWKRAIEKFKYLTSLDLHTEEIKEEKPEGEVNIGKAETEHILIVTKALIKYAEELLLGVI